MEYPIINDKCPHCGSKERLGKNAIKQLQEEGKLNKESFPEGLVFTIPLMDMTRPPPVVLTKTHKVPQMNIFYDVCADCKSFYCTKFEIIEREIPVQFANMPPR